MKKYKSFTANYVKDLNESSMGFYANVEVQTHDNGTTAQISTYAMDNPNYAFFAFESGLQVSVDYNNGIMKIGTTDNHVERDLRTHPCYAGKQRNALIRVYIRFILGRIASHAEQEALSDFVINEMAGDHDHYI
ncbi:hypothetical protein DV622_15435 [Salmonella enterica]|uniref:Uncharacterized protein n=1 Tax=Salmonella enterica subsp. enterica serovar Agona TaxID=58095 RepID=A0A5V6M8V9_SALET|nr:hypothetical protein [Salmonella enterica]EAW1017288.1 hypothetical protein [Salmonella enterica subsp. enterica serovar Agona]ECZ9068531.1 hypothetical protein [Salmonella enterica subsp. enterica serovar Derby]EEN6097121.1 hypothetical protein [Salmonella enterica subsp. enterica]EGP3127822.1 hypothetical protein [Salmonella enterica subsp. enterica serovar Montevideo]EGY1988899.1 hypothetical protein [Salmonella enterica subsp. enterica serovar Meleagridis]